MKSTFPLLCIVFILCSCLGSHTQETKPEDKADNVDLIFRISQQSRLYTTEYQVHKIVTHNDLLQFKGTVLGIPFEHKFSIGDRKIAIPMDVTLKAYIDFANFCEDNVECSEEDIHITLPDPNILVTASKIDHNGIRQYNSMWRSKFSDEEITDFCHQAIENIIYQIPSMNILDSARKNAAQMLIPLISSLGYSQDHITISFRSNLTQEEPIATTMEGETILLHYQN